MKVIKKSFIFVFIVLQPLLDVLAYFTEGSSLPISFAARALILAAFVLAAFCFLRHKKRFFLAITPLLVISALHIGVIFFEYGLQFGDIRNIVSIMQAPAVGILLLLYLIEQPEQKKQILRGVVTNFVVIFLIIFISVLTKTYKPTYLYPDRGVIGWFTGTNTPSMILTVLIPLVLLILYQKKRLLFFAAGSVAAFVLLYFNGTKGCYMTLLATFAVLLYLSVTGLLARRGEHAQFFKAGAAVLSLAGVAAAVLLFPYSVTHQSMTLDDANISYNNSLLQNMDERASELLAEGGANSDAISSGDLPSGGNVPGSSGDVASGTTAGDVLSKQDRYVKEHYSQEDYLSYLKLKTSPLYVRLMEARGAGPVIEQMRGKVTAENLRDNRLVKRVNSKILFEEGDLAIKLFGINYSVVQADGYDPENDLTAVFYYLGYAGFAVYIAYFLLLAVFVLITIARNLRLVFDPEIVMLSFTTLLALIGGEMTGAFLRKPNANFYLSLLIALLFLACYEEKALRDAEKKATRSTAAVPSSGEGGT